jgi:hypothetical protein
MTVDKMTNAKSNEEFLLSLAELSSFACFISDVTTKLNRKRVDNDLNDRYYEELNLKDEEIEFYKYADSFIKAS